MENQFVVYDARFRTDEESASIILCTENKSEAFKAVKEDWEDGVIVKYEVDKDGKTLINPKILN